MCKICESYNRIEQGNNNKSQWCITTKLSYNGRSRKLTVFVPPTEVDGTATELFKSQYLTFIINQSVTEMATVG